MPAAVPIVAAVAGAVVTSAMSDDYGAEGANDAAADASRANAKIALENQRYFNETFKPLEKSLVEEVKTAGNAQDQEVAAGTANADVTQAFDRARRESKSLFARLGVNPDSPAFQTAQADSIFSEAASRAGAMNTARRTARDEGLTKRLSVSSIGRGLPALAQSGLSQSASSLAGIGVNAFNMQRQQNADNAAAIAPLVSAVSKGVTDWWGKKAPAEPLNV